LKKVLFLIRSLNVGGAEKQLLTLLNAIDRDQIHPILLTFYSGGELLSEFEKTQVKILSAQKNGRWDVVTFIFRLMKLIREEKPEIVMSYLVASNLMAVILKPFIKPSKIVISIRHSFIRKEDYDWLTNLLYSLENKIGGWSDLLVINSWIGAKLAVQRGLPSNKIVVIPNGIDTEKNHPDTAARIKSKQLFELREEEKVVGIIGRIDPVKDHLTFLKAARLVHQDSPDIRFLIVGSGERKLEEFLIERVEQLGLKGSVVCIPSQKDLLGVYNALDICVSSSIGEGFSNVIAEAMACEVPCVVTNVGDSEKIVGETGIVVKAGDADQLASGILKLLQLPDDQRRLIGKQARQRIISEFSVDKMVRSTVKEFEKLG
jgi:glycosyltransferase involved in cell wall biosynthesis